MQLTHKAVNWTIVRCRALRHPDNQAFAPSDLIVASNITRRGPSCVRELSQHRHVSSGRLRLKIVTGERTCRQSRMEDFFHPSRRVSAVIGWRVTAHVCSESGGCFREQLAALANKQELLGLYDGACSAFGVTPDGGVQRADLHPVEVHSAR